MIIFPNGKKACFVIVVLTITFLLSSITSFSTSSFAVMKSDEMGGTNSKIVGFDVYENLIAIGLQDNRILFFNQKGEFLYRWDFRVTAKYKLFFDATGRLNIVSSRSGNCYIVNGENTVTEVKRDYLQGGMYNQIHKQGFYPKVVGDCRVENKAASVVLVNSMGNELVLYETDPTLIATQNVFLWIGIPTFLIIFFVALVKQERAKKMKSTQRWEHW